MMPKTMFRQADLERVIRAMRTEGVEKYEVIIGADCIILRVGTVANDNSAVEPNEWDAIEGMTPAKH